MAEEESVFRGIITFFDKIGIYDVVLPFLLVFTIVFAILEKTKILGTEEIDGKRYTKKNLNAMTAFVLGFLVVASTKIVSLINESLAIIVLLLLITVSFLLLIGSFYKESEDVFLHGTWRKVFMILMFIGVTLTFLGVGGWLDTGWEWLVDHWDTNWVGAIILLVIIIVLMFYITKEQGGPPKKQSVQEEKT
ncbi:MAG: hypothetical protein ABIH34_02625 [Nanoarchaeota archaeon]